MPETGDKPVVPLGSPTQTPAPAQPQPLGPPNPALNPPKPFGPPAPGTPEYEQLQGNKPPDNPAPSKNPGPQGPPAPRKGPAVPGDPDFIGPLTREQSEAVAKGAKVPPDPAAEKPTSQNQMQKQVERGQAPKGVDRVDKPHVPGQQPHVHYDDGTASNVDGSTHDMGKGTPNPSQAIRQWLLDNGWTPPQK